MTPSPKAKAALTYRQPPSGTLQPPSAPPPPRPSSHAGRTRTFSFAPRDRVGPEKAMPSGDVWANFVWCGRGQALRHFEVPSELQKCGPHIAGAVPCGAGPDCRSCRALRLIARVQPIALGDQTFCSEGGGDSGLRVGVGVEKTGPKSKSQVCLFLPDCDGGTNIRF